MEFVSIPEGKWSRIRRMSWEEVRLRLRQEIRKRADLALYRSGIGIPVAPLRKPSSAPKLLFERDEAKHRANLVRAHLPEEADEILRDADDICRHEFRLLGLHKKIAFGEDASGKGIDWHFVPHKKSVPLEPWFKINFLDFAQVGDHKVLWELNRHQHLITLSKAWLLSGNAAYANEAVAQWYSWQKANPYPLGINWASTLEVGFRSLSWIWMKTLLAGWEGFSQAFQTDLLNAVQQHGRHIEGYLSTYFSPNTHLLGEATALLFIGTCCPEIGAADRLRDKGWSILLKEADRQVRADGVYFEQALYYHVYAVDLFLHARTLVEVNGIEVPTSFDEVIKKMLDFVQALNAAGPIEGFGDDDGGRVFNPRRNHVECMADPLALGAAVYGEEKYSGARLTEEAIWLFGEAAVRACNQGRATSGAESSAFLPGGIYLIRDFDRRAQQMMIDAGPQGVARAGHGHADALSIRFALDGRRLLIDPGTYCYVSAGNERDYFRGTAAHNTLRVDEVDQAVAEGPFAWNSIPEVRAEKWISGETFDYFVGSHDGYRRLAQPVLHRRFVFHAKGGAWLVRDLAIGEGKHKMEVFWHFAPDVELREERGIVLAKHVGGDFSGSALALHFDQKSSWRPEIVDGWISPAYGSKAIAPVLRMSTNAALPEDGAVLMVPIAQANDLGKFAAIEGSSEAGVRGYRYQKEESAELFFTAEAHQPWGCGDWRSDAQLLYCKVEHGRLMHVVMLGGTFAEVRSQRFLSRNTRAESLEWRAETESTPGFSSDGTEIEPSFSAQIETGGLVP